LPPSGFLKRPEASFRERRPRASDNGAVRILVVEDEERIADALKRGLEAEGFAVDVAANGTDGLWLATEQSYDAIVLDIMLPGINGLRVCKALRDKRIWTPILMLTAKDGELDETEALDTGADDFLSKPFSYPVLLARIRALLRRSAGERPTVLVAGDLEVDPATRTCRKGGAEVKLTARELSVLEYLMRRAGEVVSKPDIIEHVWDFAFDGGDNVVEVHVSALRRKLGASVVETVRGGGYRVPLVRTPG
jgi:DNA-binding response OmpR family regulator